MAATQLFFALGGHGQGGRQQSVALLFARGGLVLLVLLLPAVAAAQRNASNSFCPGARSHVGGWAGPWLEMGQPGKLASPSLGVGGGIVVGDVAYVGVYAGALLDQQYTDSLPSPTDGTRQQFLQRQSQVGLWLAYAPFGFRRVRVLLSLRGGYFKSAWRGRDFAERYVSEGLAFSPGASLEFALTPFARLELGAGYRIVAPTDLPDAVANQNTFFGFAAVRLGAF